MLLGYRTLVFLAKGQMEHRQLFGMKFLELTEKGVEDVGRRMLKNA